MFDVTCLGNLVADALVKPVDAMPEEGKLQLVDQLELNTGGCATNSAIALAKLGMTPAIIGKIGNDGFGNYMLSELRRWGVNTSGLKMEYGLATSASVVMINSRGERSFWHCLGANAQFGEEDIDFSIIKNSRILFVAGALLMPKLDGEPTARLLEQAQRSGVYTALDTAWDSTGRWMRAIAPCLPYLDLFAPSLEEAEMLTGKQDVKEMADQFISMGVKLVVIKMGSRGCFIKHSNGQKYSIPTYTRIKPVDTTGAGDSFVAGFLTGMLKGFDLYKCGKLANAVGTHCVMKVGASNGIKSLDETLKFMDEYEKQGG